MNQRAERLVRERIQAEILSLQVDWLNEVRGKNRDWAFNYIASHPKKFIRVAQAAVNDPQFLIALGTSEMLKRVWIEKRETLSKLDASVEILNLPLRALNVLESARIKTIGQLVNMAPDELMSYKNSGQEMLDATKRALAEVGLRLKEDQ